MSQVERSGACIQQQQQHTCYTCNIHVHVHVVVVILRSVHGHGHAMGAPLSFCAIDLLNSHCGRGANVRSGTYVGVPSNVEPGGQAGGGGRGNIAEIDSEMEAAVDAIFLADAFVRIVRRGGSPRA